MLPCLGFTYKTIDIDQLILVSVWTDIGAWNYLRTRSQLGHYSCSGSFVVEIATKIECGGLYFNVSGQGGGANHSMVNGDV